MKIKYVRPLIRSVSMSEKSVPVCVMVNTVCSLLASKGLESRSPPG